MTLRDYQSRALAEWHSASERTICVVAPTGSGKSVMARELAAALPGQGLWLAHRIELLDQAAEHLAAAGVTAGVFAAGREREPFARVQCASIDTLLARPDERPPAEWIVWDEAHHAMAETYRTLLDSYPAAKLTGFTATPQRQDGKPLGDIFERLIVAAQYSELLTAGHIASCRVFRPDEYLRSDLACQPLEAYQKWGNGEIGFGFAGSVERAHELAAEFSAAGIPSRALDGKTKDAERKEMIEQLRSGEIKVLWNMYVLTEGVDVPAASVCILARGVTHAGPYLQMVGRVLRTSLGKTQARLLDLSGASHVHGLPTSDREYALTGRAIKCADAPVRNCPECGCVYSIAEDVCPECGASRPSVERSLPRIWNLELREAIESAGGDPGKVSDDKKAGEWVRLTSLCRSRGWSLSWAAKKYRELFLEDPPIALVSDSEKMAELALLIREAKAKGHKPGAAAHRFKSTFGRWPSPQMKAIAERMV